MSHVIDDKCVCCGACENECPVNAISIENNKCIIDKSKCVDCGACEGVCPTGAIHQE